MRSGRLLLVVGVIILVIGLGGVVLYLIRQAARPAPAVSTEVPAEEEGVPYVPIPEGTRQIVVAAQNIPRGTRITRDNNAVSLASWPEASMPPGALTDLEAVYDRIARVDIVLGMPVLEGMLTSEAGSLGGIGSEAALMIPRGRVAYALAVAGNASVAWAIQPGDHVDVLVSLLIVDLDEEFQTLLPNEATVCTGAGEGRTCATGTYGRLEVLPDGSVANMVPSENQRPRMVTQVTVQDAIVLRVGAWKEIATPPPAEEQPPEGEATPVPTETPYMPQWVTLAVTPQDALVLKYAEEAGASMDFVLRPAGSTSLVTTEPVTLQYIVDRFNMQIPPKLPYGMTPPVTGLRQGAMGEVALERGAGIEYSRQHQVTLEQPVAPEQ